MIRTFCAFHNVSRTNRACASAAVAAATLVSACGGGGNDSPQATISPVMGVWEGSAPNGNDVFGVVLSDGAFLLGYGNSAQGLLGVLSGTSNADATAKTLNVTNGRDAFVSQPSPLVYTFSGTYDAAGINGTVTYSGGGPSGAVSLVPAAAYTGARQLSDFVRTWRGELVSNGGQGPAGATIGNDGRISGTLDNGCRFTGQLGVLNAPAASASVRVTLDSATCANLATTAEGVALISNYRGMLQVLAFSADRGRGLVASFIPNRAPLAAAGSTQGSVGSIVALDASGSTDPEGGPLSFKWRLIAVPAGSAAAIANDTAARTSFVPDLPGVYRAAVVASDGLDTGTAETTITVLANGSPVFGNSTQSDTSFEYDTLGRLVGAVTTIEVTATDPDGDPLSFAWAASNGLITSAGGRTATWRRSISFGQPAAGNVTVTASDGRGGSATLTIRFN